MATVIDTLVIELGIDPTKLTKGQQQALAGFKKTQEEALKSGKAIEASAERVTQFLGKMRNQAVGFAIAAFGANGIRQFIEQVTTSNAALGRSATVLGTTTEALSTWRGAVKLAGGSADSLQGFVASLTNSFSDYAIGGPVPESARFFRTLGIQVAETTGKLRPFEAVLLDISEKISKMEPTEGAAFARGLGAPADIIPFLLKGPAAIKGYLAEMEKVSKVTKEAADNSTAFEQSLTRIVESAKGSGNKVVSGITPAFTFFSDFVVGWFRNLNTLIDNGFSKPGGDASKLRTNGSAGAASIGVAALASSLQGSIPNLKEFTSFNDKFHAGKTSKHNEGLALDFTVKDASKYAETASAVRRRLVELGIEGTVLDEHNHPSKGSTGSHIHVQFANAAAANKFSAAGGAGAAAIANSGNARGEGSKIETNIGTMNVVVPGGTSEEISRNLPAWIERRGIGLQAQTAF